MYKHADFSSHQDAKSCIHLELGFIGEGYNFAELYNLFTFLAAFSCSCVYFASVVVAKENAGWRPTDPRCNADLGAISYWRQPSFPKLNLSTFETTRFVFHCQIVAWPWIELILCPFFG